MIRIANKFVALRSAVVCLAAVFVCSCLDPVGGKGIEETIVA